MNEGRRPSEALIAAYRARAALRKRLAAIRSNLAGIVILGVAALLIALVLTGILITFRSPVEAAGSLYCPAGEARYTPQYVRTPKRAVARRWPMRLDLSDTEMVCVVDGRRAGDVFWPAVLSLLGLAWLATFAGATGALWWLSRRNRTIDSGPDAA